MDIPIEPQFAAIAAISLMHYIVGSLDAREAAAELDKNQTQTSILLAPSTVRQNKMIKQKFFEALYCLLRCPDPLLDSGYSMLAVMARRVGATKDELRSVSTCQNATCLAKGHMFHVKNVLDKMA
jgi:hypothetical protein